MAEALFYLATSFWLGALHAATPGHGKTIAASYIVGVRGRPIDAFVLGLFVTLSHTSGIILVAVLATVGSTWLVPHRVEAYLALATAMLVIGIGLWMLRTQRAALALARSPGNDPPGHVHDEWSHGAHDHAPAHDHDHAHDHGGGAHTHSHEHGAHAPSPAPEAESHG